MLINLVTIFLISCAFTYAATPYQWQIDRRITEAIYNPYVYIQGAVAPVMTITWKKDLTKSDKLFLQAYYLNNNNYEMVYYNLCDTYPENSKKKIFQEMTRQLLTAKKGCPVKKGDVRSQSAFSLTTKVNPLPKCGNLTVQISGYDPTVPVQYFGHFLYVLLETSVLGGDC